MAVDHLKDVDRASITLALPYGRHIAKGHLIMSEVTGSDPTHVIKFRQALSEGVIDSIEGVWYAGTGLASSAYTLYAGTQTSAPASPWSQDFAHFQTAMLDVALPSGMGDFDITSSPPNRLSVIAKFLKVKDYDNTGTESSATFSASPARVVADLIIARGREPVSSINWSRWDAWRDYIDTTETVDYSTLTKFDGLGLTGKYYSDTTFTTLHTTRIDPSIYFESSSGAPSLGLSATSFSVRWEGKIKAKGTGPTNFIVTHDDSVKLWVDDMTTPLIDVSSASTSSGSKSLTAGQFYNIKLEWTNAAGNAAMTLSWTPPSESTQVIPQQYLYPKSESRPRYEAHALFATPTTLDDALRHVLAMSNSFMQQADGKTNFYCFDELTPSFTFDHTNIKEGSMLLKRRDRRDIANRFQAVFRDLDSQYLQPADPPIIKEYDDLQTDQGRVIEAEPVGLSNCTHWQAKKVLDHYGKREVEMDVFLEFDGTEDTYQVLPGDLVGLTWAPYEFVDKQFLVLEAIDYSPETTPDRRGFVLTEWT